MVKNASRILILNILFFSLAACSISPTYNRKNIEVVIEKICKDEFDIYVKAVANGETIWIYAPLDDLINEKKEFNHEAEKKLRYILLSLKRTILSMHNPPKFYTFVTSNIKDTGVDLYYMGFIPDMIKADLQFISQEELEERVAYVSFENPEALGDRAGKHIAMRDITMGDFITYLAMQRLKKVFSDEKINSNVLINNIDGHYQNGKIRIAFDIAIEKYVPFLPDPFKEAKKSTTKFLKIYSEFLSDITTIEIEDNFNAIKRIYTPKALIES
ncbi:MAG: hypothetical protein ABH858_03320 [Candidatus Omnitrophota bacterium]